MPTQKPRFHFDRRRATDAPPSVDAITTWAVRVLEGSAGVEVSNCIEWAAHRRKVSRDEIARDVARAILAVAHDLADIAMEFGFDPTTLDETSATSIAYLSVRINSAAIARGGGVDVAGQLNMRADRLLRHMRYAVEAMAITAITTEAVRDGRMDMPLLSLIRQEISEDVAEMLGESPRNA